MSKATKPEKPPVANPPFTAKKTGANLRVQIGEETYSKRVTQEENEKIHAKMTLYNKKPTKELKATIIKLMTPETTKKKDEKEKKEVAVKAAGKKIKKETDSKSTAKKDLLNELENTVTPEDVPKLEAILAKFAKVTLPAPTPVVASYRRSGEH